MTKPQESMHRKMFPNKNRKTRLLENQLQQKLKNLNSGYGKNRFSNDKTTKTTKSRCTAKFFQTKIARRVYRKINSSKNSKIQTPDMAKISLPRGCNGKTSKKPTKKTRSISPFTIVIQGVREFFREKFHDNPQPLKQSSSPKTLREERLRQ